MGIETVWISPFFKSPQIDSGYEVADYLHVDPAYGTLEDFDNLMARAKELGLKDILTFWMDSGVAGFRIDATTSLFEDPQLRDEPLSGLPGYRPKDYYYLKHVYISRLIENYSLVQMWKDRIVEYNANADDGLERVAITEAYGNISIVSLCYQYGSDILFNFFLVRKGPSIYTTANQTPAGIKSLFDLWLENMPENGTANWQFCTVYIDTVVQKSIYIHTTLKNEILSQ